MSSATAFDGRRADLLQLGIDGLERVPDPVLRAIDHRAGGEPLQALRFAAAALGVEGVFLRPANSKDAPWYFQVRHPRFSQVVAYASPRPGEIKVEIRLPGSHDTYGLAEARDNNPYGIGVTVRPWILRPLSCVRRRGGRAAVPGAVGTRVRGPDHPGGPGCGCRGPVPRRRVDALRMLRMLRIDRSGGKNLTRRLDRAMAGRWTETASPGCRPSQPLPRWA